MSERATFKRKLKPWEALALSIGLMAPTLAMALNGALPASRAGAKVPLVFLIGFVGVAFVAYGFIRLTKYFNHAGSVYALSGATLGPQAGFFSGWALLGVYVVFTVDSLAAVGLFFNSLLASAKINMQVSWFLTALVAGLFMLWLNTRPVRIAARSLMTIEGFGVMFTVVLILVIIVKVASGHGVHGQTMALGTVFTPGKVKIGTLASATVFAFLSWAGFEASASLGEETHNPRRNIPRAVLGAVVLSGIFYIVAMYAETIGFGTSAAGVHAFASTGNALDALSTTFIGSWFAVIISIAATGSAFASAMASGAGAGRMVFALSRDGFGPKILSRKSERHDSPVHALVLVFTTCLIMDLIMFVIGTSVVNVYFYYATLGVLGILIVYAVVALGVTRLIIQKKINIPAWETIIPVLGVAYLVYVFYEQLVGVSAPYTYFPYIVALWCVIGLLTVVARPKMAKRIGEDLTAELQRQAVDDEAPVVDL
jgi:amino acid transporter